MSGLTRTNVSRPARSPSSCPPLAHAAGGDGQTTSSEDWVVERCMSTVKPRWPKVAGGL